MPPASSDFDFKELVTAAIALAIVTLLVVFLWQGFNAKTLEENQKYIIGIVLSLAGTVTGYYFGRVPAEKRADSAERAENVAKDGKAEADAHLNDTKQTLARVVALGPGGSHRRGIVQGEAQVQDVIAPADGEAWMELNALRDRLS